LRAYDPAESRLGAPVGHVNALALKRAAPAIAETASLPAAWTPEELPQI
jgi:hypothetical protein